MCINIERADTYRGGALAVTTLSVAMTLQCYITLS